MAKITEEQGKSGYKFSKLYYEGNGSYSNLKEELTETGMSKGSAHDYLYYLKVMLNDDERMTRTINNRDLILFLNHIERDYGKDALRTAITSLELHHDYLLNEHNNPKVSARKIIDTFK